MHLHLNIQSDQSASKTVTIRLIKYSPGKKPFPFANKYEGREEIIET